MDKTTCIRVFADVNQIKECKRKITSNDQAFHDLARVLDLSGNEVRLKILYLLEEEGELYPGKACWSDYFLLANGRPPENIKTILQVH
jgi:hypothetical protein